MATAPPTIESARSALSPGTSSRRFCLVAARRSTTSARWTIDLGQIAECASGANEPITRRKPGHVSLRQVAPDVVAQAPELLSGGRIRLEEFLAQPKRPERQAHAFSQPAAGESADLEAATSEIEEQAARNRKPSHRSGETVASLRLPSDNLDS